MQPITYFLEPRGYPREGICQASAVVRMDGTIEHRNAYHLSRRDRLVGRKQHMRYRYGEISHGLTVLKNSRAYVRISLRPGRSPSCPVVVQDHLGKAEDAIV